MRRGRRIFIKEFLKTAFRFIVRGDFYEMFIDDVNLYFGARFNGGEVAICEQLTFPNGKNLFERDVVKIVTTKKERKHE